LLSTLSRRLRPRYVSIPLIYASLSFAYIVISGLWFGDLLDYSAEIMRVEISKGLAFVAITTAILWYALYREYRAGRVGETTFRGLVEHLPDAVFLVRLPERTIFYVNPAAVRIFGYPAAQLIGSNTENLHASAAHFEEFHQRSKSVSPDQPYLGEFEMRRSNGEVFPTSHLVEIFSDESDRHFVVSVVRDESESKRMERELRESETRLRQIAENLREVLWITDAEKRTMIYVSPAYEQVWGRPVSELYQSPDSFLDSVHPDDRSQVAAKVARQAVDEYDVQYRIVRPDGQVRWIWDRAVPLRDDEGRVTRIVGIADDITVLRQREEELRQAQKMDAIGQLTGGIAHDFNNLLTVILGRAEMLASTVGEDSPLHEELEAIVQASERAALLTRRLLAFSRRQRLHSERVDLNTLIGDTIQLLARTLGNHIAISKQPAENLWPVEIDREQFETSLLNLAINARDAMPDGGELRFTTANVSIDAGSALPAADLEPGDYVQLTVEDTGPGMPGEIAARAFEPFFTTKEPGKGTGLGLSMVYGFVKQSGGVIQLDTAPGKGTRFGIYLPRVGG
jgi:two-component system, cell cycle sensor histidine kinase and response regulator CckA